MGDTLIDISVNKKQVENSAGKFDAPSQAGRQSPAGRRLVATRTHGAPQHGMECCSQWHVAARALGLPDLTESWMQILEAASPWKSRVRESSLQLSRKSR